MVRRLIGWLGSVFVVSGLVAAEPAAPVRRVTASYGDITCEYPEGQERLAWELAKRFTAHAEAFDARLARDPRRKADASVPLSAVELRTHRSDYLARIAAQLGLERPTPLQEECYDEFVRSYELTMELTDDLAKGAADLARVKKFAIWPRDELVRRFRAGEKVQGMAYDPQTDEGRVQYGFVLQGLNERLAGLAQQRENLRREYRMSIETDGGITTYRGQVGPKKAKPPAVPESDKPTPDRTDVFPVIIVAEEANLPPAELAEKLFDRERGSVGGPLATLAELPGRVPTLDPNIAYLVLHETAEVGVVDRYYRGKDRRWFCDGVANYVAWRVVRDRHGEAAAAAVYNLPAQLALHAKWAPQADLRRWAATEHQPADEQRSDLNNARYAFATNAVFLMHAKAGDDTLPRLFREIGKTKPNKVTMKTLEQAWMKVGRTRLDTILAEAAQVSATSNPGASP